MRASCVLLLLLAAACSDRAAPSKDVDVSAAASRAENDIANYAAARRDARARNRNGRPQSRSTPRADSAGGGPIMAK